MKGLNADSIFTFKGVQIQTGDRVAISTPTIPLPCSIDACFTHIDEDGNLNVFSTLLVPFKHSGIFKENEIEEIKVTLPAEKAALMESRNENLKHGMQVYCLIRDEQMEGQLIGAFDGIVAAITPEGKFITGGSKHFKPISTKTS